MIFIRGGAYFAAALLAYAEAGLAKIRHWLLRVAGAETEAGH